MSSFDFLCRHTMQRYSLSRLVARLRHVDSCRLRPNVAQSCLAGPQRLIRSFSMAAVSSDEFVQRRKKLSELLPPNSMAILPAATTVHGSRSIPYRFRQDPNFYYLTGYKEADTVLILRTNSTGDCTSVLATPPRTDRDALWTGAKPSHDKLVASLQLDDIMHLDEMTKYLIQAKSECEVYYDANYVPTARPRGDHHSLIEQALKGAPQAPKQISPLLDTLRVIKSNSELTTMAGASWITSRAFANAMGASHPGINENELDATLEFVCRSLSNGQMIGYPPVVAGGGRARTIHYLQNNQPVEDGDMVLVDAGCELDMYICDVSRTWPINGVYTDAQRSLYEAVLSVQKSCIKACLEKTVQSLGAIEMMAESLLRQELTHLGLFSKVNNVNLAVRQVYPHAIGHFLGLDVHDTPSIRQERTFEPGMVFTIEPGVYIPDDDVFPQEFQGLGIRIEDNVVVLQNGAYVLTHETVKEVEDVEYAVQNGPHGNTSNDSSPAAGLPEFPPSA